MISSKCFELGAPTCWILPVAPIAFGEVGNLDGESTLHEGMFI